MWGGGGGVAMCCLMHSELFTLLTGWKYDRVLLWQKSSFRVPTSFGKFFSIMALPEVMTDGTPYMGISPGRAHPRTHRPGARARAPINALHLAALHRTRPGRMSLTKCVFGCKGKITLFSFPKGTQHYVNSGCSLFLNEWCIYIALYCVLLHTQSVLQSCWGGLSSTKTSVQHPLGCCDAATGQRRQCAHHTPATGVEERES